MSKTLSLCVTLDEREQVKRAADKHGMSSSRRIALTAIHMADKSNDETIKLWVRGVQLRKGIAPRDERISTVVAEADHKLISDAAKRLGVTQHAWLQAVAIYSAERDLGPHATTATAAHPEAAAPPSQREAAAAAPGEASWHLAAELLAKTLAGFLARPERASDLATQLRKLSGLAPGAILEPQMILEAARKATGDRTNKVVPIERKANGAIKATPGHPGIRRSYEIRGAYVFDSKGNRAAIEVFGDVDAATQALESCTNCRDCTNCVACRDCEGCTSCGHCQDCVRCVRCINVKGAADANGLDASEVH